jgi:hypothetical protein
MAIIKDEELISVRNRNNGQTWYQLDTGIVRQFEKNEVKKVPFKELVQLSYSVGGRALLEENLVVENRDALELLNMTVEPEYFYTEDSIRDILFKAELPAFEDFLDFAPKGAIDLAVNIAVTEEIPDTRKRELLSKKSGININNAIMVNKVMDEEVVEKEAPKQRRVAIEEPKQDTPKRKAAAPKYNVVSTSKK